MNAIRRDSPFDDARRRAAQITVVPDSGTDQLEGLTGRLTIKIADGKHSYDFEYALSKRLEAVVGELGKVMNEANVDTLWYQTNLDVFLNRWYSNYEEARAARESNGGFLLPYKRHFFVCEAEVITAMGLAPDDPDWEKIKWDAAQPVDQEAYQRLCEKRAEIVTKDQLK